MKKLFIYLLAFTLTSVLAACSIFPEQQGNEQVKQEDAQEGKDKNNGESNENNKEDKDKESNKEKEEDVDKNDSNNNSNSNTEDDDLAAAFQDYVDQIMLLAPEEMRIIDAYGKVSGENYINDSIMYDALYNDIVPSYAEFVRALERIDSDNELISDIHSIYVEAATIQLGAFTVMISALEEQSTELVDMANQGLAESTALISEWHAQVQVLSLKTGVSF